MSTFFCAQKSRAGRVGTLVLAAVMILAIGVPIAPGVSPASWTAGATECASLAPDGSYGNDDSKDPRMSDDGRYVVFESEADNLHPDDDVMAGDSGDLDIYLRDMVSGETTLITGPRAGASENGRGSRDPDISDDGRYILFMTGQDLVPGDTNGGRDLYVYDTVLNAYHQLDPWGDGSSLTDETHNFRISGNGQYVVWVTSDAFAVEDNADRDVYLYDLASDETTLVSRPRAGGSETSRGSRDPAISDDGRYVSLFSGMDFVAGDTNGDQDLYIKDMQTGAFMRAETTGDGSSPGSDLYDFEMSGNGMRVVFKTDEDLSNGEDLNGTDRDDIYIWDMMSNETTLVSMPREGAVEWDRGSRDPTISDDGNLVLFMSGQDFTYGDTNGHADVYVWDWATHLNTPVQVTMSSDFSPQDSSTEDFHMAGDGSAFAFEADLPFFTPGDNNHKDDVFVRSLFREPATGAVRVAGDNRYATAIEVSQEVFPNGADTVVIATGANWPDALGGSALAGAVGGPILLTTPSSLPASVKSEIMRLGADSAYILGGTGAVSGDVELALNEMLSGPVKRVWGADRYATARAVAAKAIDELGPGFGGGAFVATGLSFADAMAAAPLASGLGWPVYLVHPEASGVMMSEDVTQAVVLGGTGAVPASIMASVKTDLGDSAVSRLGGDTRYDTAAMIADFGANNGLMWSGVGIATGRDFPDALAGGSALGLQRTVMLLTAPTALSPAAETKLTDNKADIASVQFLGGTAAVSAAVETEVKSILGF